MPFPALVQVAESIRREGLRWRPESGLGARGGLEVRLASNLKSVSIDISRGCRQMAEFPEQVMDFAGGRALDLAVQYSSGGGKPRGYYSVRKPAKARDYVINVQSGLMRRSWRARRVTISGERATAGIYNVARSKRGFNYPLALFTGTRFMRMRPLPQKVQERLVPEMDRVIDRWRKRVAREMAARSARYGGAGGFRWRWPTAWR